MKLNNDQYANAIELAHVAIYFYIVGILFFLVGKIPYTKYPEFIGSLFYMWDKTKDLFYIGTILYFIPRPYRLPFWVVFIYSIIRVLWEITRPMTQWDINNPEAVIYLFTAMTTGVVILLIWAMKKRNPWIELK